MRRISLALAILLAPFAASAQSVQQSGNVAVGQAAYWVSNGIIGSSGNANDSLITSLGVTNATVPAFCVNSGRASAAGRQRLCLGAPLNSAAQITLQNYGTATAQNLEFVLNGTTLVLPSGGGTFVTATGTFTAGNLVKFYNSSGVIQDAGISLAAGTQYGLPYYSTTTALTSTAASTNGQVIVGQTLSAPLWKTLSGDVSSISAAGAVTLGSVNGVAFSSSYTAHGVLLGQGTSAFASTASSNIGYCLLSQGLSADPIWAACASGSGSAGGSNTQVQFNSGSSLGGSANLTWVSPALTIGVASTASGQLALASLGGGTVSLQAPGVSGIYNFNFPTGAGSLGQPLLSGGGGSTPNSFGTLGVAGGGTNCAAASGTCLDNITGFSSTGYVNRTGAGTYAFSSQIPVSSGGTGLASGTSGGILGFTASGTIASSAALAANGIVIGGGTGATPTAITACTNGQLIVGVTSAAPACQTMSGDISTVTSGGSVTIANSAISNAKLANSAAYTLKGNFTGSSAAPQDSTIGSLTQKASPASGDYLLLQDNAAAGALKYATVSSIASAGSVSSIAGNTGAFTLTQPITNETNAIVLNATLAPQGRLTLVTGVPVLVSDQTGVTTVYYTPYQGNLVPIYDGTNIIPTSFTELSVAMGANAAWASGNLYDWFVASDSGTLRLCSGPAWSSATAGSSSRGTGAGTTELTTVNGLQLNAVSMTCRYGTAATFTVAASRGTYVGTMYATANGTTSMTFKPAASSGGSANVLGLYNAYNRVQTTSLTRDSTATWTTTNTTPEACNVGVSSGTGWRVYFVDGLARSYIYTENKMATNNSVAGASTRSGTVLNATSGTPAQVTVNNNSNSAPATITENFLPILGFSYAQCMQYVTSNTGTYNGSPFSGLAVRLEM